MGVVGSMFLAVERGFLLVPFRAFLLQILVLVGGLDLLERCFFDAFDVFHEIYNLKEVSFHWIESLPIHFVLPGLGSPEQDDIR